MSTYLLTQPTMQLRWIKRTVQVRWDDVLEFKVLQQQFSIEYHEDGKDPWTEYEWRDVPFDPFVEPVKSVR